MFKKIKIANKNNSQILTYYVYKKQELINSVIVYIHGLVSDISWFRIPDNLPSNMAIVYIQRQPVKNDSDNFMEWYESYNLCLDDFIDRFHPKNIHLMANCFGTLIALLWVTRHPEKFTTITLCNPIIRQKKNFGNFEKIKILINNVFKLNYFRKIYLTFRDFSRIPEVMNFIKNAPDTTLKFSDKFFMQVIKLRKWLNKNLIDIPIPLHNIFSYEDEVVDMKSCPKGFWAKIKPYRTSYFFTDHFTELLPQKNDFWDQVVDFMKKYETAKNYSNKIKTVLVTGATGFLGLHVLKHLHAKGYKIIALVRNKDKAEKIINAVGKVEMRNGDLNDLQSIENACKGVDAVVHTAGFVGDWGKWKDFYEINVEGTKNLAIISHNAGIKHFVLIGSLGVFGDRDQCNIDEDTQLEITSDMYSNSKIEQEFFIKKYFMQNKIPFTVIRPGFIYGEGDNNFMPKMLNNLKKKKLKFIGDGSNHINTVYVENVAGLVSEVVGNKNCFFKSYNITDKTQVTIKEFVDDVSKGLDIKTPDRHIPLKAALMIAKIFEKIFRFFHIKKAPPFTCKKITFMARDRIVNSSKAYSIINKKTVPYKIGIQKTLDYFKRKSLGQKIEN